MKKIACLIVLLTVSSVFAQFSKTHYIPPISASANVSPEEQFIYISTPNEEPVDFKIMALGGNVVEGVVSRNNPFVFNAGFGATSQLNVRPNQTSIVLSNKGYIIEASDLIYVAVRIIAGNTNHAGEIVSKGLAGLGTQFRIGGYLNTLNNNYDTIHYTFVSVLATENNTTVQFTDLNTGVLLVNDEFSGNTPAPVVLNAGQSYVIAVEGPNPFNRDGLIGSLVSSDKPIVVNCGSFGGTNGSMNNLDLGFDQIVSAERTGTDYIFIKATGTDEVERVTIIAHEDDTNVFWNGNATPVANLDAGEYTSFTGSMFSAQGNMFIQTSKNVFAYQSIGDNGRPDQANQEIFFVPPLSCETPHIIDNIPFINLIGARPFTGRVTIITQTGSTLDFVADGNPYTLATLPAGVTAVGPNNVPGNPGYVTYVVTGFTGNVTVRSTGQLYLAAYGSSDAATFGGFFSGFTFKPEVAFSRLNPALENCIPNVVLSVNEITAFDQFQWFYNDNPIPGATASSYSPTQPGYYYVTATISACGVSLTSDKIPVSDCAGDMDNDLVNDNVDLDNDNDGLTNCFESAGNAFFNLTNPLAGSVTSGGFSNAFTGSFPVGTGTPSATPFTGNAGGTFVSEVSAGKGNTFNYRMDFASPISLALEYASAAANTDLINSTGEFIVSVPVDKTITVLNPDNQLLIDTNYDGIYESNVTQFSSFEIRFRVNGSNPLPAGSGTFSFRSYLVNSLTFTHKNLVDEQPNRATFNILATCIPIDSDGDGIPDQVDLDSDNDGIPDFVETQGEDFVPLSNTDSNGDGIDNIFAPDFAPADTDEDTIPNYLDLDSDNNGIYDLVESGAGIADPNNNGIIEGVAFGTNGLANQLETSPDSGVLGYTVADTDGDGNFDYIDLDNDGDNCSDVLEAGFADPDADGILGNGTPSVNANGVVTGAGGYTTPNPNFVVATPIIINTQPQDVLVCENVQAVFTIDTNAGVTYQWQVSTNGGGIFTNLNNDTVYSGVTTPTLTISDLSFAMNQYQYRVQLNRPNNICGAVSQAATLGVNPLPDSMVYTLVQCDTGTAPDGLTLFNLAESIPTFTGGSVGFDVSFHLSLADAQNGLPGLPLEYNNVSNPQTLAVKIQDNNTGCVNYSSLILSANLLPNAAVAIPEQCDTDGVEDGFFSFDLTQANIPVTAGQTIRFYLNETDALLEQNEIATPTAYVNPVAYDEHFVYARSESNNACSRLYTVRMKVNPLPDIDSNLEFENHVVCVNSPNFSTIIDAALLDGSDPAGYTYRWFRDGVLIPGANGYTLTVTQEAVYSVLVTDLNGCSKMRYIPVVHSSTAIIDDIIITDLSSANTVTVILGNQSYGDYLFSIDYPNSGQASNFFPNVPAGIHTVYVYDLYGCPTASQQIAVLGIPNFFTPNADGFNDFWGVKGTSSLFNASTSVRIYDRYGKFLKQLGNGTQDYFWDGTYNGNPMPADDYWYVIDMPDGQTYKGHFSLKR